MKKNKVISIVLVMSIVFSAFAVPAYAGDDITDPAKQKGYTFLNKVINSVVGGISAAMLTPNWEKKSDYKTEIFYQGLSKSEYKTNAESGDKWSIGYANSSILTGKEVGGGDYYVGGSLSITKKLATEQWDDQKVRTVAISDGRGISIFSSIDCFGFANVDVRAIRAVFAEYAKSKNLNITSVNISALHQHSCVDTYGMNGDIVDALFCSSFRTLLGKELPGGQNKDYMNNLYTVTVKSMEEAIGNMETGKLYFGTVDASQYIKDKRDPQVFDSNLNRFRFVPDDTSSKETWIVNGAIHCVGNGAAQTALTGDYPYYMEQYINSNNNANFFYIEGAELAITSKYDSLELDETISAEQGNKYRIKVYGETLAGLLGKIDNEKEVAPIFNISFKEVWVDVDNNILILAAKGGLLKDNIYKSGLGKYEIVTEVGYAEFGTDIAVSIIPGELAPEIAFGGADTAATSWQGEDWNYQSFTSLTPNKKLLVFGLTNDQIGYLLTSNNWHSILTENEEIVSCGQYAGESITKAYIDLIKEVKG